MATPKREAVNPIHEKVVNPADVDMVVRDGVARARKSREATELTENPADNGADDPGAEELNKETVELKAAYKALNLKQLRANLDVAIREQEALEKTDPTETDVKRAKSVLVDTADDLHFAVQTVKREAGHLTQSIVSIAKEARMLNYGKWFDALLEVFNEGGDATFLCLNLRGEDMADLFWASLSVLALSLLLRVVFCCRVRDRVDWKDPTKRRWWWYGTLVSLLEPNTGNRMLKQSFKANDKSGGQIFVEGKGYVDDDRDPKAVRAENNLRNARLEQRFACNADRGSTGDVPIEGARRRSDGRHHVGR